MGEIVLDGVSKVYDGEVRAVDDVSLAIESGEFMVLVGPSGCGKSTLLRMIAGLEDVTEGTITIADRDVTYLAPRDRDIAMVFQNYALYPHMTVRDNIGYGLRVRKVPKRQIRSKVDEVARTLGLEPFLDRKPAALSGGQRQRVAMGRAMVREPVAFLMDEPLSNLDAKLRVEMRAELSRLHNRLGVTTVYVTHDQVEAMTLGDRVAVLRDGRLQQIDRPQHLYREPANLFVAAFIGSPSMNLVEAIVAHGRVRFGQFDVPLDPTRRPEAARERVILGVRPDAFEDARTSRVNLPVIEVEVAVVEELGAVAHAIFPVEAPRVDTEITRAVRDHAEEVVPLLADDRRTLFNAQIDPQTEARVGDRLRLSVDPAKFHFFDPLTGDALVRESFAGAVS